MCLGGRVGMCMQATTKNLRGAVPEPPSVRTAAAAQDERTMRGSRCQLAPAIIYAYAAVISQSIR